MNYKSLFIGSLMCRKKVRNVIIVVYYIYCISSNSGEKRTLPPSFQSSPQDPKRAKLTTANKAGLLLIVFVVLYMYIFSKDNL